MNPPTIGPTSPSCPNRSDKTLPTDIWVALRVNGFKSLHVHILLMIMSIRNTAEFILRFICEELTVEQFAYLKKKYGKEKEEEHSRQDIVFIK